MCTVMFLFQMELFFSSVEPEKGLAEGEAQVQIGRMMPLIQVIGWKIPKAYILICLPAVRKVIKMENVFDSNSLFIAHTFLPTKMSIPPFLLFRFYNMDSYSDAI